MPPKKTETTSPQDALASCIAVLMATGSSTSITRAQYDMMSSVNGERTASSFEHQFRQIISKSKELKKRLENGEAFPPVLPAKKSSNSAPVTPKKRKAVGQNDTSNKTTPNTSRNKQSAQVEEQEFSADDLPADAGVFIKGEMAWEDGFI